MGPFHIKMTPSGESWKRYWLLEVELHCISFLLCDSDQAAEEAVEAVQLPFWLPTVVRAFTAFVGGGSVRAQNLS